MLVFQKVTNQRRVFIADFDSKTRKITTPKLLTDQEGREFPTARTGDSEKVVFASNRKGDWQLLRQKYGAERPSTAKAGYLAQLGRNGHSPRYLRFRAAPVDR